FCIIHKIEDIKSAQTDDFNSACAIFDFASVLEGFAEGEGSKNNKCCYLFDVRYDKMGRLIGE
ncbi:MAG: hypothetical protein RR053_02860, partial [Evtepia sp.]